MPSLVEQLMAQHNVRANPYQEVPAADTGALRAGPMAAASAMEAYGPTAGQKAQGALSSVGATPEKIEDLLYRLGITDDVQGGGQEPIPGPADPQASPEDIMAQINQARQTDAMGYGQAPGGGEIPSGVQSGPLPASAEITREGEPDAPGGMSPKTRAMLLDIMSGLTNAGRELNAVPTLSDIQRGRAVAPAKHETALSGAADRIRGEQAEFEKGKTSPLVEAGRKAAEAFGLDPEKVKTEAQATSVLGLAGQEAQVEHLKAKTSAIKGETAADAEQVKLNAADMEAVAAGDLSKLPEDARDALHKKKDSFYTNSRINGLKTQVDAAQSIKSRVDASESFGATSAFRALARAAGEVGIMTDRDIKDFSERMGVKGLYDRAYRLGKSSLSPELKEEIYKVAESFSKDARENLDKEVRSRVRDLTTSYSYLQEDSIYKFFVGDEQAEASAAETMDIILEDGSVKRGVSMEDGQAWIDAGKARRVGE